MRGMILAGAKEHIVRSYSRDNERRTIERIRKTEKQTVRVESPCKLISALCGMYFMERRTRTNNIRIDLFIWMGCYPPNIFIIILIIAFRIII